MLQQETPDDYVIATGHMHSVREFVELAFAHVGITIVWHGHGVDERGIDQATGRELVIIDPRYFRPAEVDQLMGDASKAKKELGWEPTISFCELVDQMMEAEIEALKAAA